MDNSRNIPSLPILRVDKPHSMHYWKARDTRRFRISLKQWRMLHAVVDCDGFTGAARFLHMSQSAVSYTIAKLQEQLGVPLLKIEGRKARITDAGRELLERSRYLINEAIQLEDYAEDIRRGCDAKVRLVVDHGFPTCMVMLALREFLLSGSGIKVCLNQVTLPQAEEALCDQAADLAIVQNIPCGFLADPLIDLEYFAVAHPNHALFRLEKNLMAADLECHIQIAVCNAKESRQCSHRIHSAGDAQQWNMSSVDTAVEALRGCFGYAWLPKHSIQKWLDRGQLKVLPLSEGRTYKKTFYLIHGRPWMQGSGAGRLANVLHHLASDELVQFNSSFVI